MLQGPPFSFAGATSFRTIITTSAAQKVCLSDELASVGWRFAGVFMLEIDVHIHALAEPGVEAFPPSRDLLWSVVFEAQSRVSEAGGEHLRWSLLFGFG
jgi:hypothetical protein